MTMRRKTILLALALLLLIATTAAAATDIVKARIFKGSVFVNNTPAQLNDDPPILSYNGRTYVPLRKFSELTRTYVGYDEESQSIYLDLPVENMGKSEIHSKTSNDEFTLSIFSGKSVYKEGEPIKVWSRLTRDSDQPVTIYHGGALVLYHIVDGNGFQNYPFSSFEGITSTFQPGDEYNSNLNPSQFLSFNRNETKHPAKLPKGTYTITAEANYNIERYSTLESKRILKASIEFKVE
ncbi:stalk domain-containing protein [Cohnella yongneupensis]|uniref:Stalk domain-containing protein n=1 Tax=Cohnella yongneupensis TaxID=425006 RepID=A0ABW0QZ05_9BACL